MNGTDYGCTHLNASKIILGQNIPLRVQPWEMWKVATSGSMHMWYGKKF